MADYKATIFLPQTLFPMRGNLAALEPRLLEGWEKEDFYKNLRKQRQGKKKFILHLGPPYANGNMHIGHAFTTIFKDIVTRSHTLLGYDAPLVPGWDCHGLPIEWKIEEKYRKEGRQKEDVPIAQFRQECRDFAAYWIDIQRAELKRLGILADWDNPYITMDFKAEAQTMAELFKFLENGSLYKGVRPIMWSVVEKTALAEAEIEYHDHVSHSVYVRFPITKTSLKDIEGASLVIWTTTPWSLPGNRAIAYHKDLRYVALRVLEKEDESALSVGDVIVLEEGRVEGLEALFGIVKSKRLCDFPGSSLEETVCAHPFRGEGYDFDVPLLEGDHVTAETGTGLVHTAPGHGPEDFELGKRYGLEVPETVGEDGIFYPHVPLFKGLYVFKANAPILEALKGKGALLKEEKLTHSYPHSWRSKAPLIYRATAQWFISMDKKGLRDKALGAIKNVSWFPKSSQTRLHNMVEGRPDWCLSRQRAWGVPLPLFVHKATGQPLVDQEVNQRILDITAQEGCDAWFVSPPSRFLGAGYNPDDFEQVKDILDVWFDSAATQGFVLEAREDLQRPADVYLEGSDQHRGWFQSSLLLGCGTRGDAPYRAVVTHGFAMDERGRKMSKSLGNVVSPQTIVDKYGAEILRLWVVSCDYTDDYRIGDEILKHQQEIYRRYRNTLRYLLGALSDFKEEDRVPVEGMPLLEKWVLHRIALLQDQFLETTKNYTYQGFYSELHAFCSADLSSFYFDIRKDVLYCDGDSLERRATLTVLDTLFSSLVLWLSPVLVCTAEEAWTSRFGGDRGSVHAQEMKSCPLDWKNKALEEKMESLRSQRRVMTAALEAARAANVIGSSLQATLTLWDPKDTVMRDVDWRELAIVSHVLFKKEKREEGQDFSVTVEPAEGSKCERCWKILEEVGHATRAPDLCVRCDAVVAEGEGA